MTCYCPFRDVVVGRFDVRGPLFESRLSNLSNCIWPLFASVIYYMYIVLYIIVEYMYPTGTYRWLVLEDRTLSAR
jgi:hypothetical protein